MKTLLKDDKGNDSSFRLNHIILTIIIFIFLGIIAIIAITESTKDISNYSGLAELIYGPAGMGAFAMMAKAIQKKYEL